MQQDLEEYEAALPHHSEVMEDEEFWACHDLSSEFDHLHQQALLVGNHIRLVYLFWTAFDEDRKGAYYVNQEVST